MSIYKEQALVKIDSTTIQVKLSDDWYKPYQWCIKHFGQHGIMWDMTVSHRYIFSFAREIDAMWFSMRWSEQND